MFCCMTLLHSRIVETLHLILCLGFVGLVNQAMTCYLNSLLQTLYMTPEFHNAIYRSVRFCAASVTDV